MSYNLLSLNRLVRRVVVVLAYSLLIVAFRANAQQMAKVSLSADYPYIIKDNVKNRVDNTIPLSIGDIANEGEIVNTALSHTCTLVRVTVPSGYSPTCNTIFTTGACQSVGCSTCHNVALQLDCEDCYMTSITLQNGYCFNACAQAVAPTAPYWVYSDPTRGGICSTRQSAMVPPVGGGNLTHGNILVFRICTEPGVTSIDFSAVIECPNPCYPGCSGIAPPPPCDCDEQKDPCPDIDPCATHYTHAPVTGTIMLP